MLCPPSSADNCAGDGAGSMENIMAFFDLPLDQLKTYLPARDEPADFNSFWKSTLDEARAFPLNATFEKVDYGLVAQETFDVTFNGFGGQPVKGWLILPTRRAHRDAPLPCVVEFIGYGGGRQFGFDWLLWASAGYAHFVMDTRGQGSTWSAGDTPDLYAEGGNAHYPGSMTKGILDPKHYYYRRVFTDAVRAIEAARVPRGCGCDPDRCDRRLTGRRHHHRRGRTRP